MAGTIQFTVREAELKSGFLMGGVRVFNEIAHYEVSELGVVTLFPYL